MPQMMPMNWFMIYFMYLIIFNLFILLMNSFLIKLDMKKNLLKMQIKKMKLTMMNLFEMFDPSFNQYLSLNWMFMFLPIFILPSIFWLIQSRILFVFKSLLNFMYNEFKIISKSKYQSNIIILLDYMFY